MLSEARQLTRDYFDQECRAFGTSDKALGWASKSSQRLRFSMMSLMSEWDQTYSVLDVGCGHGDLFGFCEEEKLPVVYTGIDFTAGMIRVAKAKYPKGTFVEADILDANFIDIYDYVFASGIANLKVPDQMGWIESLLAKSFSLAKKGISFTMLSSFAPPEWRDDAYFYYYDPLRVLAYCFTLSPYVELKHHYLQHDFTVTVYR
ncbi:MAG: class I SAM-dependent methyltransferase [Candidatus Margulisbacteria bacterium]|nr:class I SAM-dependent methyltransferase [Candidatus Margulisiibacteriota bacterium]